MGDDEAIRHAVAYFAEHGHRQLARVSERADMAHTFIRNRAFLAACAERGLPTPYLVEADASADSGRRKTLALLTQSRPPTAIQFDNDVMAVAAIGAVREAGLSSPGDVSLLAYDDSLLCEVTQPPLSAMSHDVYDYGSHVAALLREALRSPGTVLTEKHATPVLVERGSTGPAPSPGASPRR